MKKIQFEYKILMLVFIALAFVSPLVVNGQDRSFSSMEGTDEKVTTDIETVTEAISDLEESSTEVEEEIYEDVADSIKDSILLIRSGSDVQAFELQKTIDDERDGLLEVISGVLTEAIDEQEIIDLEVMIDSSLDRIETLLEDASQNSVDLDFSENRRSIKNSLLKFRVELEEKNEIIQARNGDLLFKDTDEDGLSDYDEIYIYNTDPEDARTVGDGLTDSEKVLKGIDPTSEDEGRINFSDPREDRTAVVLDTYKVETVDLSEGDLVLTGSALPNSYVTLYIYSTPIIVTVKTDDSGQWRYSLDEELDNGEHEVFVTTVDNSGKIIARSDGTVFTKTSQAATLGSLEFDIGLSENNGFFSNNYLLIILSVLLGGIIITLMFSGRHAKVTKVYSDLHKEIKD
jgi:hypothetical protein